MNLVAQHRERYLSYCIRQKCLDPKTVKAYFIDLTQFEAYLGARDECSRKQLTEYLGLLHQKYKPRTVKRKIASLKAFFGYLTYEEILPENPFLKVCIKFQEPKLLPRTIPQTTIAQLLRAAHEELSRHPENSYGGKTALRDVCVLELLFATGMRISELCHLLPEDFDWDSGSIRIYGKGKRERTIQICNDGIARLLCRYRDQFHEQMTAGFFFVNRLGHRLSEQSVRFMILNYTKKIQSSLHITPHMFRHTFATALLEENVDIRYIQKMLGHSSITTTEIYTHVTSSKQSEILKTQHPRNKMAL